MDISELQYPISMKLQILIGLTNTNMCRGWKSIIKCYFVGYSLFSNFDFNVTHNKK